MTLDKNKTRDFCLKYFGVYINTKPDNEPKLPCFGYPISTVGNREPLDREEVDAINRIVREKRFGIAGKLMNYMLG